MGEVSFKNNPSQEIALDLMLTHKYTMLYGGSRSGKSFIIMFLVIFRALKKKSRHVVVRRHFSDIKRSVLNETFKDVCQLLGVVPKINMQDYVAIFANGSEIHFIGVDNSIGLDKILGMEISTLWMNEISQLGYATYTILKTRLAQKSGLANRIFLDLNPTSKLFWGYKLFIEGIDPKDKTLVKHPEQYCSFKMNPEDNEANIDKDYIEMLSELPREERVRFYEGDFGEVEQGALFSEANFNQYRVINRPELKKIVIAIDPAVTAKMTSDETGIVAAGLGFDNRGYLLEDVSGIFTPREWAKKARDLYVKYNATYIVAEINQGGLMVKSTIKNIDENLPVKEINATKGKITRAEPISVLYDEGRISHVGGFADAETEMALYTGKPSDDSPNRLDAIVYAMTELFPVGVYSDSELFNRDALKYWKDYSFENSTNLLYIKISSSTGRTPHYNFTALFVKIKDQKLFITDCIFNEMLPNDNIEQLKNKLVGFGTKRIFLECNPSFGAFFQELKQTKIDVRGIKEFNQEDNRIMSESAFIKESFVFEKNSESTYYKSYLQQLQSYTVSAEITESFAANILPSLAYVVKKLYKSKLK